MAYGNKASSIFLVVLLSIVSECRYFQRKHSGASNKFTAAVYEHKSIKAHPFCYESVCERDVELSSVMDNLKIYSLQTKKAKELDAKIIVFPEFGLTPWVHRNQLIPFSEHIPRVSTTGQGWIPCDDHIKKGQKTIQQQLSCMAKENEIYVVANLIDIQDCDECNQDFCLYNTNVMYDR